MKTVLFFNYAIIDETLNMFKNQRNGSLPIEMLFHTEGGKPLPPDYDKVLSFIAEEGFLREDKYNFTITYKGRMIINDGGFVGKYRAEKRTRLLEIIGILTGIFTGIAGLILSIIALCN